MAIDILHSFFFNYTESSHTDTHALHHTTLTDAKEKAGIFTVSGNKEKHTIVSLCECVCNVCRQNRRKRAMKTEIR